MEKCRVCGAEMKLTQVPDFRIEVGSNKIYRRFFDGRGEMYTKMEYVCPREGMHSLLLVTQSRT